MHILLITRHYPPEVSGGARRPFLYANSMRKLGHRVTLVTPFPIDDDDTLCVPNAAIMNGLHRTGDNAETMLSSVFISIKNVLREWVFWPDADVRWAKSVISAVSQNNLKPDWIMTTSPPESVHFAGARLSKKLGIPWVAELRDTWTRYPHRQILRRSAVRRALERRLAKSYLKHASAITSVSEAVLSEARNYALDNTPECIVSHFSGPPKTAHIFDQSRLNLVHTGGFTLSDHRRKLETLINALANSGRTDFTFHIAGRLTPEEVSLANSASIPIKLHGQVSLDTSRAMQAGADALILYTPEDSHALPGKYAEYAATGKPIYYCGSGDWLDLAQAPNNLRPLSEGLTALSRSAGQSTSSYFSDREAAKTLIAFLKEHS